MSTFSIMDIGRTGVGFSRYWMDTVAHNLANVGTVRGPDEEPFRARMVVARSLGEPFASSGSGVGVGAVVEHDAGERLLYDPVHPLADEQGYIRLPLVDLAGQFADLIQAQRAYQVNLKTVESGREAYEAALRLGQR